MAAEAALDAVDGREQQIGGILSPAEGLASLAEGVVGQALDHVAGLVGDDLDRAEMVAVQIPPFLLAKSGDLIEGDGMP